MTNKILPLILCNVALGLLTACSAAGTTATTTDPATAESGQGEPIRVVTTIFPEYDWARAVAGEDTPVEITQLMDGGVDLHSYQATAQDLVTISDCDVLIYTGGESSAWVEDTLHNEARPGRQVINLMEVLGDGVKEEEVIEGMEADHDHEAETGHEEEDEHVWLSLKNAQAIVPVIADALAGADEAHADIYRANGQAYCEELTALDEEYRAAVAEADKNTLLFGDRFPFRYLVDDYGLTYYAAFPGCSAEAEASFATISFLAGKVDELGLHTILTLEDSDGKIARTIADNTQSKGQSILVMDSMQTTKPGEGKTYLSLMRDNLAALQAALQ